MAKFICFAAKLIILYSDNNKTNGSGFLSVPDAILPNLKKIILRTHQNIRDSNLVGIKGINLFVKADLPKM